MPIGGTFPVSPLDIGVDLNLAGTWTSIAGFVNHQANKAVDISRGRPDGAQAAQASTATMQWDNRDGRFTTRNPSGPYYGALNRNTPIRVHIPGPGTYLRFTEDNAQAAFPGWGFEDGTVSGWYGGAAVVTSSTAWSHSGTRSLLVTADGTGVGQWMCSSPSTVACVPGNTVVASAWVHALNNLAAVHVNIDFYTSVGGYISTASGASPALTAGSTAQFVCSGTAPATAAFARMSVIDSETSAAGVAFLVDDASLSVAVAGNLEVQADMQLVNWTTSVIASRYVAAGNLRSWALWIQGNGTLAFGWSTDGTYTNWHQVVSSAPVPLGRGAVKVTFAVSTGTVTFFTAPTIAGTWTQLGNAVVWGATSLYASPAPLLIAANPDLTAFGTPGMQARVYGFKVLNGIAGPAVQSADFTVATAGSASYTDALGNAWTPTGTASFSNRDFQFYGECSALPQTMDPTVQDIWTPVSAAGLLRRLGQGNAPVYSPLKRAFLSQQGTLAPTAYWPCEDPAGSTSIASATGGRAMTFIGSPGLASESSFLCSEPIATLNGSQWTGNVPAYTGAGSEVIRFLMHIPSGATTPAGTVIMRVASTGTIASMELRYQGSNALTLAGFNAAGTALFTLGPIAYQVTGIPVLVSIELTPGATITYALSTWHPGDLFAGTASGTVAGTIGVARQIAVNPGGVITDATGIGHISVQGDLAPFYTISSPLNAWQGETAGNRFTRLCAENSIGGRVYGYPDTTAALGAQPVDTLINLLRQCEDADRGMIYEARDSLAVGYRTLASMLNQPKLVLDMAQDQVSPPLEPTDDDQYTANDITGTRTSGSSFRATLSDGSAMSTGIPPNGVGSYQQAFSVNVRADSQLPDIVGWALRVGTVNETRYPAITVDLASRDTALGALAYQVVDLELGDAVSIINPPSFLPPGPINALVWGERKPLGVKVLAVTWQTQPESPYETQLVAATGGPVAATDARTDTDGSSMVAGVGTTDRQINVATPGTSPLWTTIGGSLDYPFDVNIGGERVTVGNVDGPPVNFLTGQSATFDGGLGTAINGANSTIAATSIAHLGTGSMAITSVAAGTMTANSCSAANILTQGLTCAPGDVVAGAAWFRAATVSRVVNLQIGWYNSAGTLLSATSGPVVNDATGGSWVKATISAVAPASTARARLTFQIAATAGAGEIHYVDDVYLADVTTGIGGRQTFTVQRSVNGVVKSHVAGEDVRLFTPTVLAVL